MSTEKIYNTVLINLRNHFRSDDEIRCLDIGSGSGELLGKIRSEYKKVFTAACDYTNAQLKLADQKVDIVDLNSEKLPYQNESFDLVTATEIIEHLENQRGFLREIHRVLKSGGVLVLSTPNILNIKSRLRFLWFGFAELFGPLPIDGRSIESCFGHISPISYFYLYHGLREAGFMEVFLDVDKYQRSGILKLLFFCVPIMLNSYLIKRTEIRKYKTINETNADAINQINSIKILLGRTVIVVATKI